MKTLKKELIEALELEYNSAKQLKNIIDDYIEIIQKEVPNEYMHIFGIGVAGSHRQFGPHYGFWNKEKRLYTCVGKSYHISNDFNAYVPGSSNQEISDFAKYIIEYINDGISYLKERSIVFDKLYENLKFINDKE